MVAGKTGLILCIKSYYSSSRPSYALKSSQLSVKRMNDVSVSAAMLVFYILLLIDIGESMMQIFLWDT